MASKFPLRFQLGKRPSGWYWHLRAKNGEIVAQSEGYKRRSTAVKVWKLIVWHGSECQFEDKSQK